MLMGYAFVGALGLGFLLTGLSDYLRRDEDPETVEYLRQMVAGSSNEDRQRTISNFTTSAEDRLHYAQVKIVAGIVMLGMVGVLLLMRIY